MDARRDAVDAKWTRRGRLRPKRKGHGRDQTQVRVVLEGDDALEEEECGEEDEEGLQGKVYREVDPLALPKVVTCDARDEGAQPGDGSALNNSSHEDSPEEEERDDGTDGMDGGG